MTVTALIPTHWRDDRRVSDLSPRTFKTHILAVLWCWAHASDVFTISAVRGDHSELIDKGLWTPSGDEMTYLIEGAPSGATLTQLRRKIDATSAATSGATPGATPRNAGIGFSSNVYTPEFEQFWKIYPNRKDKRKAAVAFDRAMLRAPLERILAGARSYANDPNRKPEFTKYAEGWLNGDRWLDEAPAPAPAPPRNYDSVDYGVFLEEAK